MPADTAPTESRHLPPGIYVESRVRGSFDDLWRRTQEPELHERWDLRFTRIEFLSNESSTAPRKFRYATRIGFGLEIEGEGETATETRGSDGESTSALRFWSDDRKSLIKEGSGYWRYVPTEDGIRFLTWYSYQTRFGAFGRAIDRMIFRPLLGWATAWSFDRLRLWIERGIDPALSMQRSLIHAIARVTLAFVFLYHGLVPKLLWRHPEELALMEGSGISAAAAPALLTWLGVAEVALGIVLVWAWRARLLLIMIIVFMVVSVIAVAVSMPEQLIRPFNPVTLNAAAAALALVALLAGRDLPSAARCLRRPAQE